MPINSDGKVAYIYKDGTWYAISGAINTNAAYTWTAQQTFASPVSFQEVLTAKAGINNFQSPEIRDTVLTSPVNGTVCFIRQETTGGSTINQIQYYDNGWKNAFGYSLVSPKLGSYTITESDAGKVITVDSSSASTITVPTNAQLELSKGFKFDVVRLGSGTVLINSDGTILSKNPNGAYIDAQYGRVTVIKLDTNTWVVSGDIYEGVSPTPTPTPAPAPATPAPATPAPATPAPTPTPPFFPFFPPYFVPPSFTPAPTPAPTPATGSGITTTYQREAPEIEALKVGAIESAKALADIPLTLPSYQVANLTPEQQRAAQLATQGIGAYTPYLQAGKQIQERAVNEAIVPATQTLRQLDIPSAFLPAAEALLSSQPLVQGLATSTRPAFSEGIGSLRTAGTTVAGGTGQFGVSEITPFLAESSPYTQGVINEAVRQINRQGELARMGIKARAAQAGAFGGSRQAVEEAELERNLMEQRNAAITGALERGYTQALGAAQQSYEQAQQRDIAAGAQQAGIGSQLGQLGTQAANVLSTQAQLQQALGQGIGSLASSRLGTQMQQASGLGALAGQAGNIGVQQAALGEAAQRLGQGDITSLFGIGEAQRQLQQQQYEAGRQTALQNLYEPYQRTSFYSDILRGAPSSQMATSVQQQATQSPFMQALGLGIGALSTAAAANKLF